MVIIIKPGSGKYCFCNLKEIGWRMWEKGGHINGLSTDVLMSRLRKDEIVRKITLCANFVKQFFYSTKSKMYNCLLYTSDAADE